MDYRSIPSVDRLLSHPRVQEIVATYSRGPVVDLVRRRLEETRKAISEGKDVPSLDEIAQSLAQEAASMWQSWPRPVINATGVILHTNLGRAPLSDETLEAMMQAARGYTNLELDLEEGRRGSRQAHIQRLLCQLTGAEASLVVNNNASAVLLGLAAIARGKEVIVSRGEAVEIGGGFRIPDVLRQSGAILVEVGATNKTYAEDYANAITPNTGALLRVHASNFRITGFVHSPTTQEMVEIGRGRNIPVLYDLGSGCLLETAKFGLAHEPTTQEAIDAGVELAFFSGDKLLGGPQAGIIVGKREWVQRLAKHPLARAVRIDKVSMAGLNATLLHYLKGEAIEKAPIWRMIAMSIDELERKARAWQGQVGPGAEVVRGLSAIGGGSLPGETLPTWLLALRAAGVPGGAQALAKRLRDSDPPVVGRIEDDLVLLDPRTVLPGEEEALVRVVTAAVNQEPTRHGS